MTDMASTTSSVASATSSSINTTSHSNPGEGAQNDELTRERTSHPTTTSPSTARTPLAQPVTESGMPSKATPTARDAVAAAAAATATVADLRHTAEYKAAWDLELWKAIQADRFRRQLARHKSRALADLARVVQAREKAASQMLAQRSRELETRATLLAKETAKVEQRQQRLTQAEKEVQWMRQRLSEAERRAEDELRTQVRRANEDITHKMSLMQERVKAAEAQTQRAEERQRQAQNEYLQLYEEFARFRTQQVGMHGGAEKSGTWPDAATGSSLGRCEAAALERQRAQHLTELQLLEQRHSVEMMTCNRRCRELEEQNRHLTAALARRREQLRRFTRRRLPSTLHDAGDADGGTHRNTNTSRDAEEVAGSATVMSRPALGLMRELQRLRQERVTLVRDSGGALGAHDGVVLRLDARIAEVQEMVRRLTKTSECDARGGTGVLRQRPCAETDMIE